MISLIQSCGVSTTFADSSSPQSQSLDWFLADPFCSGGLLDDRLEQRFVLTYGTDDARPAVRGQRNVCKCHPRQIATCMVPNCKFIKVTCGPLIVRTSDNCYHPPATCTLRCVKIYWRDYTKRMNACHKVPMARWQARLGVGT